jgi:hypothetical protein
MEVANTLAYYDMPTITAVKSFIVQPPVLLLLLQETHYKTKIKIFSGPYYKPLLQV